MHSVSNTSVPWDVASDTHSNPESPDPYLPPSLFVYPHVWCVCVCVSGEHDFQTRRQTDKCQLVSYWDELVAEWAEEKDLIVQISF